MAEAASKQARILCKPLKADPAKIAEKYTYLLHRAFRANKLGRVPGSIVHMNSLSETPPKWRVLSRNYVIAPDFANAGFLLLLSAAHTWKPKTNPVFEAYAMLNLRRWKPEMERTLRSVSFSLASVSDISAYRAEMQKNPEMTLETFARTKEISIEKAKSVQDAMLLWTSSVRGAERQELIYSTKPNEPVEKRTGTTELDFIAEWCSVSPLPEEQALAGDMKKKLAEAISLLPGRERDAIAVSFGVGDDVSGARKRINGMDSSKMRVHYQAAIASLSLLLNREDKNLGETHKLDRKNRLFVEENERFFHLMDWDKELALRLHFGVGISRPHRMDEIATITGMHEYLLESVFKKAFDAASDTQLGKGVRVFLNRGVRNFLIAHYPKLLSLKETHRNVLQLRFGFLDGRMHTLGEIAQAINRGKTPVSVERIRQLEGTALFELANKVFTGGNNGTLRDFFKKHRAHFPHRLKYLDAAFLEKTFHFEQAGKGCPKLDSSAKVKVGKSLEKIMDTHYFPLIGNWIKMDPALMKFVYDNFHLLPELKPIEKEALELRFGIGTRVHSYDDVSEEMGLSGNFTAKQLVQRGIISLFTKVHSGNNVQSGNFSYFSEFVAENEDSFASLTPLQQRVLVLRFGLDGENAHGQRTTAKLMKLKRARLHLLEMESVSQLIKKSRLGAPGYLLQHSEELRTLPSEKRRALELYFGLGGNTKHSLTKLQCTMGISSFSRTRQILDQAMWKVVAAVIENETKKRFPDPIGAMVEGNPQLMDALNKAEWEIVSMAFGLAGKKMHTRSEMIGPLSEQGIHICKTAIFQRKQNAIIKLIAEKTRRDSRLGSGQWLVVGDAPGIFSGVEPRAELIVRAKLGMANWRPHTLSEVREILEIESITATKHLIEDAFQFLKAAPTLKFDLETDGKMLAIQHKQQIKSFPHRMRKIAEFWIGLNGTEYSTQEIAEKMNLFPEHVEYLKGRIIQSLREKATTEKTFSSGEPMLESIMN